MPAAQRITGLTDGAVDVERQEIRLTLTIGDRGARAFVMRFGVAAQVIGALGRMFWELRRALDAQGGHEATAAEDVAAAHVQKDRWSDKVLVQLITPAGVPYTFAVRAQAAAGIAEQLQTESARSGPIGHA